jgi:4-amino-4-deoxy-L-arabinose transferase and related glycosyltransferases of PMT family
LAQRTQANIVALLFCALFITIAVPWIDKPGIQTDEALFAAGIYPPFQTEFRIRMFHHDYPIMVMTYVGALKARIWAMIFAVWPPSPASVRIPAVLLGALSVWWTYLLALRTLGPRTALVCVALLATDPMYVLYSRWDHGPVVIQHLCLIGAMLALVRFHQECRIAWLAAGFFALGLGFWEKAVFIWLLGGLGIAGLILFRRQIREALSLRNAAVATAAFVLGASPLIVYNAKHDLNTFRTNTVWSAEGIAEKARLVRYVLEGNALLSGSITRDSWDGPLKEPATAAQKAVVSIALAANLRTRSLMGYLAMASVLLFPFVWRTPARKAALFVLICGGLAWCQMAFVKNAGGAAHHTILLWPLPAMGIAAVLSAVSQRLRYGRLLLIAVAALACIANLLVLSTYYTNLLRNGGTSSWTDAMYPAFDAIHQMDKEGVCTIDWGFFDTLRMFEQGHTPLCIAADPVNEGAQQEALFQVSHPRYLFLTHTQGSESFPGVTERFVHFAESKGFECRERRVFADSNGRSTVEIFRFMPVHNGISNLGKPAN